jgi:glycopeptide antibiotics resistance protein
MRGLNVLPWLIPGLIISSILGLVVGKRVGQALRASSAVGWGLVLGFGLIVSATLTPLRGGLELDATGLGSCDLSRFGIAPLQLLLRFSDQSLNVLLFIPLGIAIGLVPGSRRKRILAGLAVLLPIAIESAQSLLPILGRGCQSGDVFDNLTGLLLGWLIGTGARLSYGGVAPRGEPG